MKQLELFSDFTIRTRAEKMARECIDRGHDSFIRMSWNELIAHIMDCMGPSTFYRVGRGGYISALPRTAVADVYEPHEPPIEATNILGG